MRHKEAAVLAIGLFLMTTHATAQSRVERRHPPAAPAAPPAPQPKTASDLYWDVVRATAGPIGFPKAAPGSLFAADPTRPSHPRGLAFGSPVFVSLAPTAPPAPAVFVPVFVPGPTVYVPVPTTPVETTPSLIRTPSPRRPETFYVIPGCYVGDRPPQADDLPKGCDITALRGRTW